MVDRPNLMNPSSYQRNTCLYEFCICFCFCRNQTPKMDSISLTANLYQLDDLWLLTLHYTDQLLICKTSRVTVILLCDVGVNWALVNGKHSGDGATAAAHLHVMLLAGDRTAVSWEGGSILEPTLLSILKYNFKVHFNKFFIY